MTVFQKSDEVESKNLTVCAACTVRLSFEVITPGKPVRKLKTKKKSMGWTTVHSKNGCLMGQSPKLTAWSVRGWVWAKHWPTKQRGEGQEGVPKKQTWLLDTTTHPSFLETGSLELKFSRHKLLVVALVGCHYEANWTFPHYIWGLLGKKLKEFDGTEKNPHTRTQ